MRVRHLTDIELQGLLDRREVFVPSNVSGNLYLKDMDSQEHVDNCPACRGELELYRQLYSELGQADEVKLPRNFASRVTFSLPPFRAQRTRARLQMAAIWATSLLISLFWIVAQADFARLVAKTTVTGYEWYRELGLAFFALGSLIPHIEVSGLHYLTPLLNIWGSVVDAFRTDINHVNLVLVAGAVLLVVAGIDHLFLSTLRREHQ